MTSMPSRTADSNAATVCWVVERWPTGDGTLKTRYLPIQAFGATPLRPAVGGWSRPPGELVPERPAAMPATCVAWNEARGSTGSRARRPAPRTVKLRATITFGVVYAVRPLGKPGG